MKLGLDIHGVIDNKPEFFSKLAKDLMAMGWEVHIITGGSLKNGKLLSELTKLDIQYTHVFSVYDHLIGCGAKTNEELGIASKWPFPDETWNEVKSIYCRENEIDMHIDDMQEYLGYFTTPYMYYKDEERNHYGQFGQHKD